MGGGAGRRQLGMKRQGERTTEATESTEGRGRLTTKDTKGHEVNHHDRDRDLDRKLNDLEKGS